MKSHPRHLRVKGDMPLPNQFIFGEAVSDLAIDGYEYVIHTHEPFFVCKIEQTELDPVWFKDQPDSVFASQFLYDEEKDASEYICSVGFRLFDFFFPKVHPTVKTLLPICDEAILAYEAFASTYAQEQGVEIQRELEVLSPIQLPIKIKNQKISDLLSLVHAVSDDPETWEKLEAGVKETLTSGDASVFTETQLVLRTDLSARKILIQAAEDLIAFPKLKDEKDQDIQFQLWALPVSFSRAKAGVWWYFPKLEALEPILKESLGLEDSHSLWVSPTVFTLDMLNQHACQDLVYLAPVLASGKDLALQDIEQAREVYLAQDQIPSPDLFIAWIPFLTELDTVSQSRMSKYTHQILDMAMPVIQEALSDEMEYGEAELFAPMRWWEALENGVKAWNRKRLGLMLALVSARMGGVRQIKASSQYLPERQAYMVTLRHAATDERIANIPWVVTPSVAPDKDAAFQDLMNCMEDAGLQVEEIVAGLH